MYTNKELEYSRMKARALVSFWQRNKPAIYKLYDPSGAAEDIANLIYEAIREKNNNTILSTSNEKD